MTHPGRGPPQRRPAQSSPQMPPPTESPTWSPAAPTPAPPPLLRLAPPSSLRCPASPTLPMPPRSAHPCCPAKSDDLDCDGHDARARAERAFARAAPSRPAQTLRHCCASRRHGAAISRGAFVANPEDEDAPRAAAAARAGLRAAPSDVRCASLGLRRRRCAARIRCAVSTQTGSHSRWPIWRELLGARRMGSINAAASRWAQAQPRRRYVLPHSAHAPAASQRAVPTRRPAG